MVNNNIALISDVPPGKTCECLTCNRGEKRVKGKNKTARIYIVFCTYFHEFYVIPLLKRNFDIYLEINRQIAWFRPEVRQESAVTHSADCCPTRLRLSLSTS